MMKTRKRKDNIEKKGKENKLLRKRKRKNDE